MTPVEAVFLKSQARAVSTPKRQAQKNRRHATVSKQLVLAAAATNLDPSQAL